MKRLALLFLSMSLVTSACGDDGAGADAAPLNCPGAGNAENPGFNCPDAVATAWNRQNGVWTEVGQANFDCLGTPSTDEASTVDINLGGQVRDFESGDPVPDAAIELFPDVEFGNVLATATSDVDANYTMTMPTGQTRVGFKITADGSLPTYLLYQYFDPGTADQTANLDVVSEQTANLLPAIIGISRTPGLGVLAGAFRDCDGNEVSNVIATVSSTSGTHTHLEGAQTYYFSAGSSSLPVNHGVSPTANSDGLFVVLELPPSQTAYLQVWGFTPGQDPATAPLTLLSEIPSPVEGDSVITASLEPLRQ